jgi:hypothetical protein
MDAVLASFCFDGWKLDTHPYNDLGWCQSMPPVSFRTLGASFVPDYSIFFLCDTFYVDEATIDKVARDDLFAEHDLLFKALRATGRLRVVDYAQIVQPYKSLITSSIKHDLAHLEEWCKPFLELTRIWNSFKFTAEVELDFQKHKNKPELNHFHSNNVTSRLEILKVLDEGMVSGVLDGKIANNLVCWKKHLTDRQREYTREILTPYLGHVAASLCLSDCLSASLHDWSDIVPLYQKKLTDSVRIHNQAHFAREAKCRELVEIMIPAFRPRTALSLAKALDDKRVESLRRLVDDAVTHNIDFDVSFANSVLRDVLRQEERLGDVRKIVGWMTTPISMIPWIGHLTEKSVEYLADKLLEAKFRKQNAWFLWLTEIAEPPKASVKPLLRKMWSRLLGKGQMEGTKAIKNKK